MRCLPNVAAMNPERTAPQAAQDFVASLDLVDLSRFRVVGAYTRYDETVRNTLQDARQKILAGFDSAGGKRENHLVWAAPGTGKTYFVQQVAASMSDGIRYHELNLAKCGEPEFRAGLGRIDEQTAWLCLVDEIDARPDEPWPFEALLPYLDAAVERHARFVFVLAGSGGASLDEIKQRIAVRPKGTDLLSRIPAGHEYTIAPMSLGDRVLIVLSQFREAGAETGREIRAVEKLALYFVARNSRLANARQLREFAVRAVERVPKGDDRLKYDHLFVPGDPENKAFWVETVPVAGGLANTFVTVRADRVATVRHTEAEGRPEPAKPARPADQEATSMSGPRTNVPRQLTSFIGRDREIAEVKRLLSTSALLTLTGAGGCGKTRLALRVAEDLKDQYPHGVTVVELGALSDSTLVPGAVATALELPERSGRALIDILTEYLRPKTLLLVLDNCEHVVTGCAELAGSLLRSCPALRILATSREPLDVPGERAWRVPPLSVPDAHRPLSAQQLRRSEAVQLLVDRVASHHPEFAVTDSNAAAVVRLCTELDGLPLAIELAAARVKILTVGQVADRLGDRFRLLTGGGRTAQRHHQTLRATMDWSYGLLSVKEQIMLRRLSAFAGGWRLEAAEAICAGAGVEAFEVLDLLAQLVDKSLVAASTQDEEARYGLLATVRQYAREKLQETGEAADVQGRHFDWYLTLAERADAEFYGALEQTWLQRLMEEHDNLRAALEWAATDAAHQEALPRLAAALGRFWNRRAHASEGRIWLERALGHDVAADSSIRARVLYSGGVLARQQGDYEEAGDRLQKSLDLYLALQDKGGIATAIMGLGGVAEYRGDHAEAMRRLSESLGLFREIGDEWGVASTLNMLGETTRAKGDHEAARSFYEESLTVARRCGHPSSIAIALANLGVVALRQGDHERAKPIFRDGLVIMKKLGDTRNMIAVLSALAGVAIAEGKPERAGRLLGAADSLRDATGVLTTPADRAEQQRNLVSAREALDPDTFASSWAAGKAMTLDEVVEYALAD